MKDEKRREMMLRVCKDAISAMETKRERDATLWSSTSYGYRIGVLEELEEALRDNNDEGIIAALWDLANFPKDMMN